MRVSPSWLCLPAIFVITFGPQAVPIPEADFRLILPVLESHRLVPLLLGDSQVLVTLAGKIDSPPGGKQEPVAPPSEKPQCPPFGDLDNDCDIDQDDIDILIRNVGKTVGESICGVACDIHFDGMITTEDLKKLKDYCTRPNCATK